MVSNRPRPGYNFGKVRMDVRGEGGPYLAERVG
jgi:hypothetical protein